LTKFFKKIIIKGSSLN